MIELFALGAVQDGKNIGNIVFVVVFNFFFQRLGRDGAPDDAGQFLTVVGMLSRGVFVVVVRMALVRSVFRRFGSFQILFFPFILFLLVHVSFLLFSLLHTGWGGQGNPDGKPEKGRKKTIAPKKLFPGRSKGAEADCVRAMANKDKLDGFRRRSTDSGAPIAAVYRFPCPGIVDGNCHRPLSHLP